MVEEVPTADDLAAIASGKKVRLVGRGLQQINDVTAALQDDRRDGNDRPRGQPIGQRALRFGHLSVVCVRLLVRALTATGPKSGSSNDGAVAADTSSAGCHGGDHRHQRYRAIPCRSASGIARPTSTLRNHWHHSALNVSHGGGPS